MPSPAASKLLPPVPVKHVQSTVVSRPEQTPVESSVKVSQEPTSERRRVVVKKATPPTAPYKTPDEGTSFNELKIDPHEERPSKLRRIGEATPMDIDL